MASTHLLYHHWNGSVQAKVISAGAGEAHTNVYTNVCDAAAQGFSKHKGCSGSIAHAQLAAPFALFCPCTGQPLRNSRWHIWRCAAAQLNPTGSQTLIPPASTNTSSQRQLEDIEQPPCISTQCGSHKHQTSSPSSPSSSENALLGLRARGAAQLWKVMRIQQCRPKRRRSQKIYESKPL